MQSEELEKYLSSTGHVGLYDDGQFSCFCDKPLITASSPYPISPSGGVDIQEQIRRTTEANATTTTAATTTVKPPLTTVKTKAITREPIAVPKLDLGDTDIVNGTMVTVDRTKAPVQASHTLADVYTPTQVLTQADLDEINRVANAAQAKQDAGQVNAFLDRSKTNTPTPTTAIPGKTTSFGGGWLWLILLAAGAGLVVSRSKKTKTVEL